MEEEEIKFLLQNDESALPVNGVSQELLKAFDDVILSQSVNITEDVHSVYKKFMAMKQDAPQGMKNELFAAIRNFVKEKISNKQFADALLLYRFLVVKSELLPGIYSEISHVLFDLGNTDVSLEFLSIYEKRETNKPLKYLTLANFYNLELKDYKTAIGYYEKYLKIDETKSVVYTILASLYVKAYGDIGLKDQIYYFEKAYRLKPNDRLTLHGLAFAYERIGDRAKSDKFYRELLNNNPTETDYYNYGAFLISCGDLKTGHKYFTRRFYTDDPNMKYPDPDKKWDMKSDISDKTLLIHYEQGFGDTFMYCRFVPYLKKFAKKIIFRVQDSLSELIKNSKISEGIEIISDKLPVENLDYDVSMALLDAVYVLGTTVDDIPFTQGYLDVSRENIEEYAKKYLKQTSKFKIGIAYQGDKNANYNGRDIDLCRFKSILNLENIEFYSLQVNSQQHLEGIKDLGDTFKTFTDTASAIKNMDLIITTDNVILNLAGALGVKTFGLFNYYTNFRWYKLREDNVGWYKSVKPFQVEENNRWSIVFSKIYNEISELTQDPVFNKN